MDEDMAIKQPEQKDVKGPTGAMCELLYEFRRECGIAQELAELSICSGVEAIEHRLNLTMERICELHQRLIN